ncbi:MAG TPA: hypothetical protein VGH28_17730 [Polyangiaceae bacterium]
MHSGFPAEVTDEEAAFGFTLRESPTGVRAVVRALGHGLQAVKRLRDDGSIEYSICDERCQPLYSGAASLDELRRRFEDE